MSRPLARHDRLAYPAFRLQVLLLENPCGVPNALLTRQNGYRLDSQWQKAVLESSSNLLLRITVSLCQFKKPIG